MSNRDFPEGRGRRPPGFPEGPPRPSCRQYMGPTFRIIAAGPRGRSTLLAALLVALASTLSAQPPICGPNPTMTSFCADACIICDIDGFTGRNAGPVPNWDQPNNFCAPIAHNLRWIGFVAGSTSLTLEVSVSNCTNSPGNAGLQMGLFQSINCDIASSGPISNCIQRVNQGQTGVLTTTVPLVVGQYYWLVIDGWSNDVCDYSVAVTSGSTAVGPVPASGGISGPTTTCVGANATYTTTPVPGAPNNYWYVDGVPQGGSSASITPSFPGPGTYTVCVEASNTCNTGPQDCQQVTVRSVGSTTTNATVCPGQCYTWEGLPYCTPATYTQTVQTPDGCDSTISLVLTQGTSINASRAEAVCPGGTVTVAGTPYGPGSYTVTVPSTTGGCDTTLTLTVTQLNAPATGVNAVICPGDSYVLGSQTITGAGTYTEVFTAANGCDSTVTASVSVDAPPPTNLSATICDGDAYAFDGQTLTTSGSYTATFTTANGCDSVVNLNLTALPPLATTLNEQICDGASVTVGTTTYTTAGTYTQTLTSAAGCDSVVTLNLTVDPTYQEQVSATICDGDSYPFGSQNPTTTGTYTEVFTAANGCDSAVTLTLTVVQQIVTNLAANICDGDTYAFNGQSLSSPGSYSVTLASAAGCDSVVNLTLAVDPNPVVNLAATICDGDGYQVGTQTFTAAGSYSVTLASAAGCDSTVNLTLAVTPDVTVTQQLSVCDGQVVTVGGQPFSTTGVYTVPLTTPAGCDSTVVLDLTVNPAYGVAVSAQICAGDSYQLGAQTFTAAGLYTVTLFTAAGCDSTVTLDLDVASSLTETVTATICPGDTYAFNGGSYGVTGNYPVQLTSAAGCDSTAILDLTVLAPVTTQLDPTICAGDSYQVGAQSFTTAGQYTVTLASSAGCDSTVYLDLTVAQPQTTSMSASICPGDRFAIAGQVLTQPGNYTFVLLTSQGCDSTVQLTLTQGQSYAQQVAATICPGSSYELAGQTFTSAGSYQVTLPSVDGCDSTFYLQLQEAQTIVVQQSATICQGDSYAFGGNVYAAPGTYYATFAAAGGCDSTVQLDLEVVTGLSTQLAETICEGDSFAFGSQNLTASGTYTQTLASVGGCDSVVTLDLVVVAETTTALTASLCAGETYTVGQQTFATTGQYAVGLFGAAGCDSTVTLHLYVASGDTTELTERLCAGGSVSVGAQTFTATGVYVVDLTTASGCDSTVRLDLVVDSEVALTQTYGLCPGESVSVAGTTYSSAGTYQVQLAGVGGACDTALTIVVTAESPRDTAFAATICAGDTYAFDGAALDAPGTYTAPAQTAAGCDSTATLTLTVLPRADTAISATICAGERFAFGSQNLDQAGTYAATYASAAGCDSTVTLTLGVLPTADTTIVVSLCDGETVTVGGVAYGTTGTYTANLLTASGCDSAVTLQLTVASAVREARSYALCPGEVVTVGGTAYGSAGGYQVTLPGVTGACDTIVDLAITITSPRDSAWSATICAGQTYRFGGADLDAPGTYAATAQTAAGCDSTATLTLDVLPASSGTTSATICAGDSYRFDGREYTASGTYVATFAAANGCDSVVTLDLTVRPPLAATLTREICAGGSVTVGTQTFDAAGRYTVTLAGTGGCDSVVTLDLAVVDSIAVRIDRTICRGEAYAFGGQQLTMGGTYREVVPSAAGCDSATTLLLAVTDTVRSLTRRRICRGDSTRFGGSLLADAGTYTESLPSAAGCDSVAVLELTLAPTYDLRQTASICAGSSYAFAGQTYSAAGSYAATLRTSEGCDSSLTLDLAVVDTVRGAIAVGICAGETYAFAGQTLTAGGVYRDVGSSVGGCDSVTTLTLTVADTLRETITATVCAGDTYTLGGVGYGASGSYDYALASSGGCDSVVTLSLTVLPEATGLLDTTLCDGDVLRVGGREFRAAGSYTIDLVAASGCDSTLSVMLAYRTCGSTLALTTDATDVRCHGEAGGSITVAMPAAAPPVRVTVTDAQGGVVRDSTFAAWPPGGYTFAGLLAGTYAVEVSDASGGTATASEVISEPRDPLSGELVVELPYGGYAIRCAGGQEGAAYADVRGGTEPYTYRWSNDGGMVDGNRVAALGAGRLDVEVADARGCPWADSARLAAPPPMALDLDPAPVDCDDPAAGGAILATLTGGRTGADAAALLLRGVSVQAPDLEGLAPGDYVLTARDAYGCEVTDSTRIEAAETPKLELGADREIAFGDTLRLRLSSTLALDSVAWTPSLPSFMSCVDCATPLVAPTATTAYTVVGYTEGGCRGEEVLLVRVRLEDEVYAPTAFSPDGDAVNDFFTVYAEDEDAVIRELMVFDRWGESVFRRAVIPAGVPGLGWDGTFRGARMDPAVFVFWARVELSGGREVLLTGDVTLVR